MAALRSAGHVVASAKVGPDFIDPGYHSLATGRPPRNLDPWICGPSAIGPLAGRAGVGADITVIEGVMGLFDGSVDGAPSSTADVAGMLTAPVVLVVDGSSMSASIAALVAGYRDHQPGLRVAGVILNRVGSDDHVKLLREALDAIAMPVLGALKRDDTFAWRDRHLGLVPVAEQPTVVADGLKTLAAAITAGIDLDQLVRLARSAPATSVEPVSLPAPVIEPSGVRPRFAIAGGRAFTFVYQDNIEALEAAGAEVISFDPLSDDRLPEGVSGLIAGGGFPEVFAGGLAENRSLLEDLRARVDAGLVVWAECAGLLWLAQSLADQGGVSHRLAGLVATNAAMGERLTLGYREATLQTDTPIGKAGTVLRGHEFHYSTTEPGGSALELTSRFGQRTEGFATPTLFATYLHLHLGGDPTPAAHFVSRCASGDAR